MAAPGEGRRARLAAGAVAAAIALATPAPAQISPGRLARAHRELEGASECFRCHGAGSGGSTMNDQCTECHREIAWLVERGRGLHAAERGRDCASCHPDHAGEDFELIAWDGGSPSAFDHARAGFVLEGRHATIECRACHTAKYRVSPVAGLARQRDPDAGWIGLERACASCHADPHLGTLGDDCTPCHGQAAWKPASRFDHAATAYPLTGKHADAKCDACHRVPGRVELVGPDGAVGPRYRGVPHDECSACHRDVHRGRLGPACASCHVTDGFERVDRAAFDHARTRFPLRGRHADVKCAACHDETRAWGARPPFETCGACHRDAHAGTATLRGRPADCAACHDERAFSPSSYTVADHAGAPYALAGRHREVRCRACHPKAPAGEAAGERGTAGVLLRPASAACTDCHRDDHNGQLRDAREGIACESCHRVDGFRPSTFTVERHAGLALPLDGAHRGTACADCHGPERRDLHALPGPSVLGRARVALTTIDAACATCHFDPHGGRFAAGGERPHERGCAGCHGVDTFRVSTVDADAHDAFAWRLDGAHRAVPCFRCHAELERPAAEIRLLRVSGEPRRLELRARHGRCADCHDPFHGGQFASRPDAGACDACHGSAAFRPASRFDHDRDGDFALAGAHAGVACERCHTGRTELSGRSVVLYRPTPRRCRDCHAGEHAGSPPEGGPS